MERAEYVILLKKQTLDIQPDWLRYSKGINSVETSYKGNSSNGKIRPFTYYIWLISFSAYISNKNIRGGHFLWINAWLGLISLGCDHSYQLVSILDQLLEMLENRNGDYKRLESIFLHLQNYVFVSKYLKTMTVVNMGCKQDSYLY